MTQERRSSRRLGVSLWLIIGLLVILAALGGAGYWGWLQFTALQGEKAAIQARLDELDANLARQQRQHQSALAELEQQQTQLQERLSQSSEVLSDLRSGGQRMWLLSEARALASLAGQRLMLTQEPLAARRLLQAADQTLARLDDPEVLKARQALAVDMEKLSGAAQVNVQSMVLRLGALRALVPQLLVPSREPPAEVEEEDERRRWWEQLLDRLPIAISRHDGEVPLPLDEAQTTLVRLTLDAGLQQAQLSLMQGRARAYEEAVTATRETLETWFRKDDSRTRHLVQSLEELSGAQVQQALPEIGAGLAAIRELQRKEGGA